MQYTLSYRDPAQQYLDIEIKINGLKALDVLHLQLPAWRPGRYELGNFAKNVQRFQAATSAGKALRAQKASKDSWMVQTGKADSITVSYRYYAAELNAGSTWLDSEMLYVNPVNCLMYRPDAMHQPATVVLKVPRNYEVATGMPKKKKHILWAEDVQQLMDCPFIASAGLQHDTYKVGKTVFHVWFAGESRPHWSRLKNDFTAFSKTQIKAFGDFPVPEYHFLIHSRPEKVYHGVEHSNSTVLALGPAYAMFTDERYYDLLALSSHELYHTWNIKAIRPEEMLPYDFSKENYSRLGYVAEGVTTYMGDLMLIRSGGFSHDRFLRELSTFVQKYYDNFGRFNLSVADSSFDTWLDGYVKGVPHRKVSIYNEGALNAMICDLKIMEGSKNKHSLDSVMRALYEDFAKKGIGYHGENYRQLIEQFSGRSFKKYFEDYLYGTRPLGKELAKAFKYVGLEIDEQPARLYRERALGLRADWGNAKYVVSEIYPGSPAEKAGLMYGDELLYFNNFRLEQNLDDWLQYFGGSGEIGVKRGARLLNIRVEADGETWFRQYTVRKSRRASKAAQNNYQRWTGQKF